MASVSSDTCVQWQDSVLAEWVKSKMPRSSERSAVKFHLWRCFPINWLGLDYGGPPYLNMFGKEIFHCWSKYCCVNFCLLGLIYGSLCRFSNSLYFWQNGRKWSISVSQCPSLPYHSSVSFSTFWIAMNCEKKKSVRLARLSRLNAWSEVQCCSCSLGS